MNNKIISFVFLLLYLLLSGIPSFGQRFATYVDRERLGYKDARGRVRISARFIMAGDFSKDGLAIVIDEQGWALIDRTGRVVVRTPFIFDGGPDDFVQGLARFTRGEKFGFYDRRGKVLIAPQFDFALPFHEGLAAVCLKCVKSKADSEGHYSISGGRWGFINRRGVVFVPLRFEEAENFENGKARVKLNNKWIYIDHRGRVLDPE